jgi:hypothetical protein
MWALEQIRLLVLGAPPAQRRFRNPNAGRTGLKSKSEIYGSLLPLIKARRILPLIKARRIWEQPTS